MREARHCDCRQRYSCCAPPALLSLDTHITFAFRIIHALDRARVSKLGHIAKPFPLTSSLASRWWRQSNPLTCNVFTLTMPCASCDWERHGKAKSVILRRNPFHGRSKKTPTRCRRGAPETAGGISTFPSPFADSPGQACLFGNTPPRMRCRTLNS
jgi:hypothetical protein